MKLEMELGIKLAHLRLSPRHIVVVFALLIGLASAIAAPTQNGDKTSDSRLISEGAKLFATSCGNAYCHGSGGQGGGAPRVRGKGLDSGYLFKTISNGITGTAMPSFKSELSEAQIRKLVAFIMSDSEVTFAPAATLPSAPAPPSPASTPVVADAMIGSEEAGKALFFDSAQPKSCHFCHAFQGQGTLVGPDLSKTGSRSPRDLFLSTILPREIKDTRYATVSLILRGEDKIVGVKKEEDAESIRIYDTVELPAVLRTVQKSEVVRIETVNDSVMPKDYASRYTVKQLLDLIAFLKGSESKAPVTLKDLF